MRHRPCLIALLCAPLLWSPAPAEGEARAARAGDEARAARAVLETALKALGGADKLAEQPAPTGQSRGTLLVNDAKVAVTNGWSAQGLDQLKWSTELTADGRMTTLVLVLNGDKAWLQGNGQPASAVPGGLRGALKAGVAALHLAEDPLPLRGKAYKLAPLGELNID